MIEVIEPGFELLTPDLEIQSWPIRIEMAGRTCYRSEDRTGEDTAEKFCKMLIRRGHECFDGETEVLTVDGWKRWEDVSFRDHLATRTDKGVLEYHFPINLIRSEYKGPMIRVDEDRVSVSGYDHFPGRIA